MDSNKRKKLEAGGWKVDSVGEFLALSREESEYIELKLKFDQASPVMGTDRAPIIP